MDDSIATDLISGVQHAVKAMTGAILQLLAGAVVVGALFWLIHRTGKPL